MKKVAENWEKDIYNTNNRIKTYMKCMMDSNME